ncbi:MAG: shikimate dehydrogenase [Gammaproteobacteria bacterium]|nr:shikimate dehydrogenase [Gammaproteobacteria bacterium]
MIEKYAVIGNPIKHSKSPEIHTAFARQTGQSLEYTRLLAPKDGFAVAFAEFATDDGKGLSVTMPFKQQAFQQVDIKSERAVLAGAVNTIKIEQDGQTSGDNTDGVGLVNDITRNLNWAICDKRVLILGAGGAVRGVLQPFLHELPAELVIANRTVERAIELAEEYAELGNINASGIKQITGTFDLIINATGASLQGEVPNVPNGIINAQTHCYDMTYAATETAFVRWARKQGATVTSDGLGMLVEQAALAFQIWRGVLPDTRPVIKHIRTTM